MIYEEMPEGFNPVCEVVSCFLEHDGKVLLLHRQDHKPQGNTWAATGGKVDEGESLHDAIKREAMEEIGIALKDPKHFKKLFIRFPKYDFIHHIFHEVLDELQDVVLSLGEHKDFKWVEPAEALKMPLMEDEGDCIKLFYEIDEEM